MGAANTVARMLVLTDSDLRVLYKGMETCNYIASISLGLQPMYLLSKVQWRV